jgi:hypothetical protein
MAESVVPNSPLKQLLVRVVVAKQLTSIGAKALAGMGLSLQSEEDVLRWLAQECGSPCWTTSSLTVSFSPFSLPAQASAKPRRRKSVTRLVLPPTQTTF